MSWVSNIPKYWREAVVLSFPSLSLRESELNCWNVTATAHSGQRAGDGRKACGWLISALAKISRFGNVAEWLMAFVSFAGSNPAVSATRNITI